MNHDHGLESSLSTQPSPMSHQGKIKLTSTDDEPNPDVIGKIKPEHPIAIDTVFRRILLYLDCADLISCSQIWWNCYQITKDIFKPRSDLTIHWLHQLEHELAETTVQNIGHLTMQSLHTFFNDPHPEMPIKLVLEHPKLKYLTQLTFNDPFAVYLNLKCFHNLMRRVGQRLQVLCMKGPRPRIFQRPTGQSQIFPISRHGNRETDPQQQLLECKNMKRLVLHCYGMVFSITGIALTFPNLVELYLKGIFGINVAEKLKTQMGQMVSKQQAKGQVPPQQPSPQQSRPQLLHLQKLSIIYEPSQLRCARSHLSVLTAMEELQLKHLELVNVLDAELIIKFLGTQSKTLETLKLLTTSQFDTGRKRFSYPTKLSKFVLPGKFLKLQEITLAKLFISDKFKETLKAIPNATKITFQLMPREIWESILQRTNLTKSDQPTTKVNTVTKTKMPQPQPKAMPPKPTPSPTTHNNIKEISITGQVKISDSSLEELKQIFPNCVNISL